MAKATMLNKKDVVAALKAELKGAVEELATYVTKEGKASQKEYIAGLKDAIHVVNEVIASQ